MLTQNQSLNPRYANIDFSHFYIIYWNRKNKNKNLLYKLKKQKLHLRYA